MVIITDLNKLVDNVIEELKKEDPCDTGAIKSVESMKGKMALHAFSLKIIGSLQKFYNVDDGEKWFKGLNGNGDVLGLFEDCVYDCIEKRFRDGRSLDMVTFSTGHTRESVEKYNPVIGNRILAALKSIHSSNEVFEFVMKVTATAISGRHVDDRFQIWAGPGGNGKGVSKIAFSSAFGTNFYEENGGCLHLDMLEVRRPLIAILRNLKENAFACNLNASPATSYELGF